MIELSTFGFLLNPILAIVFCINLVAAMKKVKREEDTARNTFWMSMSLGYIIFSLTTLIMASS
ncbi:hypothetical protein [Sporosarcina cyprini]|uniref:hypothetical protein n=1 Tax=Sporosarcina cyprini TaxID=2910523 RepID=UPI001EDD41DB|nr:hypothetical protein [Sporosarcina cyprini]MCG3088745.1 hypothetical protein [Sporosarcina cyprini]